MLEKYTIPHFNVPGRFYSGFKLLEKKDLNGKEPAIYMITSNRTGGKTYFYTELLLRYHKETGRRVFFLFRNAYEKEGIGKLFDEILYNNPEIGQEITTVSIAKGLFIEIFLDGESLGYAFSLNTPDKIKKYRALFHDVDMGLFDEFITETGIYNKNEINQLQSVLFTIGAGEGHAMRPIKLFMLANNVTILNPYFLFWNLTERIRPDSHFIRGNGVILELFFNSSSAEEIAKSGIGSAFANSDYQKTTLTKEFMIDVSTFITKMNGKSRYRMTLVINGKRYGVRDYNNGYTLISRNPDPSHKLQLCFNSNDHGGNTQLVTRYAPVIKDLKQCFENGALRFDSLESKNAFYEIMKINVCN